MWIDDALLVLIGLAAGVPLGSYLDRALWPRPRTEPAPIQSGGLLAFEQAATFRGLPVGVERPGSYARIRWGILRREQWEALAASTASADLYGAGKPFTRSELEQVRDLLISRGVAFWRNDDHHAQGWELRPEMVRAIGRAYPALPRRDELVSLVRVRTG